MNKKANDSESTFFLDWSILSKYFIVGFVGIAIIAYLWNYPLTFIGLVSFALIIGGCLLSIEFVSGKFIYKDDDWWQEKYPLARISCSCSSCQAWRRKRKRLLFLSIPTLIFSILILSVLVFLMPYIPFDYGTGHRISKTNLAIKVKDIEIKLEQTVETDYYKIKQIPTDELVKNKKGKYYIVDLRHSLASEKLLFEPGRYIISPSNSKFIDCNSSFIDSVYSYIQAGFDSEIFVKGSADLLSHKTFIGHLEKGYDKINGFAEFEVLPKAQNGFWNSNPQIYRVADSFTNNELPNLRGRFIQYTYETAFARVKKPIILDGDVEFKESNEFRNAYLILYYDPNKPK